MPKEESVPEHQQTPEHEYYETFCALAAGGHLESTDFVDFQAHIKECSLCRADYQELSSLVAGQLPQAEGTFRIRLAEISAKPLAYSRQRFLRRARAEGVVFSREVETPARSEMWYLRPLSQLTPVAAVVVLLAVGLTAYYFRPVPNTSQAKDAVAAQQLAELKRENSALTENLSQLNQSLATGQREIKNLRAQLGSAATTADSLRQDSQQSLSRNAQLLDESRNQEKLLAEARDEVARSGQSRTNDEASLVEQQTRITELSNKLRIASATLDEERRLAAAGKDAGELMAARQLHVIDVRDTDSDGNPSKTFGRVFLTEGKSLTFYAFDLNEERAANVKRGFQVWAADYGNNSARSLGFLHPDAKASGRWVLRVENPKLVEAISSVFVTVEPAAGGKQPSGQKLLYAYLGEANHP
jgi:hypothetical protein